MPCLMERPSDYYRRVSEGPLFISQEEHYRKQFEKSNVDLDHVEDELGMLEAMLIDEPEYENECAAAGDLLDQTRPFGNEWWDCQLQIVQGINPSLKDIDVKKVLLDLLKKNGENVQHELFELLGTDLLDLITELLENREIIIEASGMAANEAPISKKLPLKEEKKRKDVSLEEALRLVYLSGQADSMQYPFVFTTASIQPFNASGKSVALPLGTDHENLMEYESFKIPHYKKTSDRALGYPIIDIRSLGDTLLSTAFPNYNELNQMQSICFNTAYETNENMLVCAPTGAGKTDVAVLTVLKCIKEHALSLNPMRIATADFKIIYVAPMKALAAEITNKFSKRLAKLNIIVRECTGDMQLTRQDIQRTQMLVTTPEKWDVLSRKGVGDVELVQLVKLLIVDEVHLLHDNRGAVLEAIVARTLRQVEIGQSMIRIVGLSATLPNYVDVAAFLRVNPFAGMFFFDDAFRPVPLTQHFIGVKGHQIGLQTSRMMNICFDRCVNYLQNGHQVMIFVHSRNDTIKTARSLLRLAGENGFSFAVDSDHQKYNYYAKESSKSKNAELKELFKFGIGIHHAGMLRPDRTLTESMFECGVLRVLICTATLAWGVNLPAHAVIIKGTQVYDGDRGGYVDISVLDVLQIFGRAGRPQYETHGEGLIITTHDKLHHYLHAICSQTPIESKFIEHLPDNLNAEIALGTVANVQEAVQWLAYTFLFVRMRRNPLAYGINLKERMDDPECHSKLFELVKQTAHHLKRCAMIAYDQTEQEGFLKIKNIGRIASLFYLSHRTVELFVKVLRPEAGLEDLLELVCQSNEFDSIKVREEEMKELDGLREMHAYLRIKGDLTSISAKVNTLIQCYISRAQPEMFSLQADLSYIQQNTGRILRALFEIVKGLGWAKASQQMLVLCCCFERRRWQIEHPLLQYENIPADVVNKLNGCHVPLDLLVEADFEEIGMLARNHKAAGILKHNLNGFPRLDIKVDVQPLTSSVLKISCEVTPLFVYDSKVHFANETFHGWIEDSDGIAILSYQHIQFPAKELVLQQKRIIKFFVQIKEPSPSQFFLRVLSDRWLHSEHFIPISLHSITFPADTVSSKTTPLLPLSPLPISALGLPNLISYMQRKNFQYFNPVQTQVFHTLFHRDSNALIGAPTGSGKTVLAELAIFRQLLLSNPRRKAVYLAPLKALVKERVNDWALHFPELLGLKVVELTGDHTPSSSEIQQADLIVASLEKWDGVSRKWQDREYVQQVGLMIIDEIHLLGIPGRGAILEAIVMRMNSLPKNSIRILGLSTALANASDLADWLAIPSSALFNFSPAVRPVPVEVRIEGFPGAHYCPRMAAMNKPLYGYIRSLSEGKPALIFVSSRRQTRLTAQSIISYDTLSSDQRSFLRVPELELEAVLVSVQDEHLKHALSFGIGLHHSGLSVSDRLLVESLFGEKKILLLVATATLAWGINLPAYLVVVKGTEYYDAKSSGYVDMPVTDVMQMIGRAGRPQFDVNAKAVLLVSESKKMFYRKFLFESFPVESSLLDSLADHLNSEVVSDTVYDISSGINWLKKSFLYKRIVKNPSYYHAEDAETFMHEATMKALDELARSGCIQSFNTKVLPTFPGKIASFYYLKHLTIRNFIEVLESIDSVDAIIKLISDAKEYDDAPLRHNEDLEVRDLVMSHPNIIPSAQDFVRTADFGLPQTKVYVLFRAWMHRLKLPYTDFVTDQTTALDQSMRIAQGFLELLMASGKASSVLYALQAMQCLKQACHEHADSLLVYFGPEEVEYLRNAGIRHLPELLVNSIFPDFRNTMPDIDIFKSKFKNLHSATNRLDSQTGSTWYVICANKDDEIILIQKLNSKQKLSIPLKYNSLYVVSDTWYGVDQEY